MGPRTGPRPASSTPNAHAGPGFTVSVESEEGSEVGRSAGGTAEKWVYDAPEKRCSWLIDGAMKTSDAGISNAMSPSIWESAISTILLISVAVGLWKRRYPDACWETRFALKAFKPEGVELTEYGMLDPEFSNRRSVIIERMLLSSETQPRRRKFDLHLNQRSFCVPMVMQHSNFEVKSGCSRY